MKNFIKNKKRNTEKGGGGEKIKSVEIPANLKTLYKHWPRHTENRGFRELNIDNKIIYNELIQFINERIEIFVKKESGLNKPYTSDPILAKYRFCNIYRELDRQTIFYHKLLKPVEDNFELWLLNMLFCRSICNTETIEKIGLLSFDPIQNKKVMERLLSLPSPKYGTAYIFPISLIQRSEWGTREKFFCEYYPLAIPKVAKKFFALKNLGVSEALEILLPVFGFNLKFLFTELLIDIAYQYPDFIDLYKKFPIGPGSKPTMKTLSPKQEPELTNLQLTQYFDPKINLLTFEGKPIYLSAENWEGIGCEFRKYTNLKLGKGRRRKYFPI